MNHDFELTILTPCQVGGEKLIRTIQSVNSAIFTGIKIQHIILHNRSSPLNLIEVQGDKYELKILSKPDNGPYHALNQGIKYARGQFVQVLNTGDIIMSMKTLRKACQKSAEVVSCAALDEFGLVAPTISRLGKLLYDSQGRHEAVFIRREVMDNFLFDTSLSIKADRNQFLSIIKNGHVVLCIDEPVVMFEASGLSSASIFPKEFENLRVSLRHTKNFFHKSRSILQFLTRVFLLFLVRSTGLPRKTGRRLINEFLSQMTNKLVKTPAKFAESQSDRMGL